MKKETQTKTSLPLAVFAGLALVTASAQAASITIANAGFEDDLVATNTATNGSTGPVSWNYVGSTLDLRFVVDGAYLNVATSGAANVSGPHSGDQFFLAHVNPNNTPATSTSTINQDTALLWSSLSAGDRLTVKAWTTYRADVAGGADTHFWLNDVDGSGISSPTINVTDAAQGVWTERMWEYTVTQTAIDNAAANSWGAVNVQVGITVTGGSYRQVAFDDVSLEYAPIPEPSTMLLSGGLCLLGVLRRRR